MSWLLATISFDHEMYTHICFALTTEIDVDGEPERPLPVETSSDSGGKQTNLGAIIAKFFQDSGVGCWSHRGVANKSSYLDLITDK